MLDVDSDKALQRLKAADRDLPSTTTCRTGRGWHYYYRVNGSKLCQRRIDDGIDVRVGGKGYVIVPPSIHPESGRPYQWKVHPRHEAEAPPWLIQALAEPVPRKEDSQTGTLAGVQKGQRNNEVFRLASKLRRVDIPWDSAKNLVLEKARACSPPLPEAETLRCLDSDFGRYNPEPRRHRSVVQMSEIQPVKHVFAYPEPLDLSQSGGIEFLREEIRRSNPSLVAIDPVVAYVGRETDTHRANQVRAIYAPLARLAEEERCSIVSVVHLNKGRGGNPIHCVQGSIDFVANAQSVLLVGSQPDQPHQKALIHIKSNIGPQGPALGFTIDRGEFFWTGMTLLTAEEVLEGPADRATKSAQAEAEEFLREALSSGSVPANQLLASARKNGISEKTLRRAKNHLGVETEKMGMNEGWEWFLPRSK